MAQYFFVVREDKHPGSFLSWQTFLFFWCAFLISGSVGGQDRLGRVVLEPDGIPGAFIPVAVDGKLLDTTDQRGVFSFPEGLEIITFLPWQIGYDTIDLQVPEKPEEWLIHLQPTKAYQLPDAVVPAYPVTTPQSPGLPTQLSPHILRRTGGISLAAAFNSVPGVFMHTGALNTNRITIRGIGSRTPFSTAKIRAYLDEIPLTNGEGETTLEDLDPELFERVDIWKGPGPAAYGSGLGGLIQLHTRRPSTARGSFAKAWGVVGSFGTQQLGQQVGWQSKSGKVSGLLHNVYLHSDGFRENNTYERLATTFVLRAQVTEAQQLTLFARRQQLEALIPSSLNEEALVENPAQAASNWAAVSGGEDADRLTVGLSWQALLGEQWSTSLSGMAETFSNDEIRPFNTLAEDVMRSAIRGRLSWESPDDRWNWELGGEFFLERYNELTFEPDSLVTNTLLSNWEEDRQYGFGFTQLVFHPWPAWTISADLNVNRTAYQTLDLFRGGSLAQSGTYAYDPVILPRFSVAYRRGGSDRDLRVALIGGRGFSAPTVAETLAPGGVPNPDIQPEQGWNAEVAASGRLRQFRFNFSGYSMWVNDLLVPQRVGEDQFVGVNAGQTLHQGLELSVQAYTALGRPEVGLLKVFASSSLARFRFVEFSTVEEDFNGNRLPGVPEFWMQGGGEATLFLVDRSELISGFQVAYTGPMALDDGNTGFTDSYLLVDASIGWRKSWKEAPWQVDIRLGLNNVTDANYSSMIAVNARSFGGALPRYFYPGLPRHFFTRLTVTRTIGNE